ncbi:Xaa-Pro peptidase family protein [Microbacterium sp. p3-SID336]|uniref:M24 family metallopeptidase n=1 Tax=Microbacterium sp. p3-SID336 TaxID=2916212 RepID=UPI0021A6F27E|nr:Xaa-Pro peptidase family protein [Microbacterium sp. p3-SID336]MCT1479572.1 Xaa-Pro peptidase family protein [Microbacterium sp. p3-SID336]
MTVFDQRLTPAFFDTVQQRVRERMVEEGFDAVLTDHPEDIAYLTGFFHHPSERPVAIWLDAAGRTVMLLPELEREYAQSQSARAELVAFFEYPGVVPPFQALADAVSPRGRVAFATTMPYQRLAAARAAMPDAELIPSDLLLRTRYVKFPEEVALHREAARITDLMLEAGVALVRDAVAAGGELPTETELERHVTAAGTRIMYAEHRNVVVASLLAGGLVYSGANSAFPHGLPSVNRLRPGDTFMLSLGCAVGGRFIEGERTFVLGEPTADQRRYHDTIRAAQQVGRETIRAGLECREANRLCLDVIREAGLGEYIRHRQGHGIGLGMHEAPWLEDGDPTLLEAGMVVSNEPGIYVPGHAGYRISDSMLVTDTGAEPLTTYPRSLDDCTIAL